MNEIIEKMKNEIIFLNPELEKDDRMYYLQKGIKDTCLKYLPLLEKAQMKQEIIVKILIDIYKTFEAEFLYNKYYESKYTMKNIKTSIEKYYSKSWEEIKNE